MSKTTAQKAAQKAAKAVATAYRSTLGGGSYGAAIAAKQASKDIEAMVAKMGALTKGMYVVPEKHGSKELTPTQKAARKRVLSAHKSSAARAARLPGGKKSGGKKPLSKAEKAAKARVLKARQTFAANAAKAARLKRSKASKKAPTAKTAPAARRAQKPKVKNVTADGVVKAAAQAATKRWLCEGAKRSGCGAGGSRVVTGQGRFVRIRPPRFMTAG